jgi:hypothetical protein
MNVNSTAQHDTYQEKMLSTLLFHALHRLANTVALGL